MGDQPRRDIVRSEGGGFFDNLTLRIKLILRLMADRRVNPLLKLLPLGTIVYLFVPDLVLGPLDDAAVIWLGSYLFVELCPPAVVNEHMRALTAVIDGEWREVDDRAPDGDDPPQG